LKKKKKRDFENDKIKIIQKEKTREKEKRRCEKERDSKDYSIRNDRIVDRGYKFGKEYRSVRHYRDDTRKDRDRQRY